MAERDHFANVSRHVLDANSLNDVLKACQECSAYWKPLGLSLGLHINYLNGIERMNIPPKEKLENVLDAWLRKTNTIPGSLDPSYYTLCDAVAKGGENRALAERIAEAHPSSADTKKVSNQSQNGEFARKRKEDEASNVESTTHQQHRDSDEPDASEDTAHQQHNGSDKPCIDVRDPPPVSPEDRPQMADIESEEVEYTPDLVNGIEIILMTVTEDEFCTVMANVKPLRKTDDRYIKTTNGVVTFYLGKYGLYNVAVMRTRSGQNQILRQLPKLLKLVKAKYIISVGMCYGFRDDQDKLGDVIVARAIHDFTDDHQGPDETKFDNEGPYNVKSQILSVFEHSDGFSMERFVDDNVKVRVGAIVSKPTVVKRSELKRDIKRQAPASALGGEMEGAAIVTVAQNADPEPQVITVKGIADWGYEDKEKFRKWQAFAANAAAKYVHYRMSKSPVLMKKKTHFWNTRWAVPVIIFVISVVVSLLLIGFTK